MTKKHLFAAAAFAVPLTLVTTAMMGQGSYPTPSGALPGQTEQSAEPMKFIERQEEDQTLASSLIGRSVTNPEGESIGKVSDLLLDEKGGLTALVLEVGGFLGIGGKKVAVSLPQLQQRSDETGDPVMVLAVSTEELEQLAAFKSVQDIEREREAAQRAEERTREAPNRAQRPGGVPAR